MDDDSHPGGVYKGPHGDVAQAYIVSAPFELVDADKVGEAAGDAKPLGINGQHVIMGEYKQAADNPQRSTVTFQSECRVLSPGLGRTGVLHCHKQRSAQSGWGAEDV